MLKVAGQIATITIPDCTALARHSKSAGVQLRDAIWQCDDRDDLKVIVLRSEKPDFCAAREMPASGTKPPTVPAWWNEVYASASGLYQALCFSKKVTITAVHGACADAGALLVLCSDLTIAEAGAKFHSPFLRLPEANFVLAALTMRLNRVKSWMLAGEPLGATAALEAGLINQIADCDVTEAALAMARSVARIPLDGIAMSKLMVESCLDAQGVGQDFDMAGFYAAGLSGGAAFEAGEP